ncbi:MAG: electron transfer flavoprotein subunit alpha/FixB family protein, partial [Chloroflexi bacterium]|nr:electron transfer flavoprotein subunit alpha/FixB family protein [Chloroflexota bacterium]
MHDSVVVLVVGEAAIDGSPRQISWEMLAAAREVAGSLGPNSTVTGLFLGSGIADAAHAWGAGGADRVIVVDDERLAGLIPAAAATALSQAIAATQPAVVIIPGTTAGRDYAPLVAARLGVGLAADCVSISVENGTVAAERPVLAGRALSRITFSGSGPVMVTVRSGSFQKAEPGLTDPVLETVDVTFTPDDLRVSLVETAPKGTGGSRLDSADIVISGGRGLKEPARFDIIEELAEALGAAVGATRAVVDAGWRPHHEQIGQTGRTVSPRLYIAVGVSGAVQHNVGM